MYQQGEHLSYLLFWVEKLILNWINLEYKKYKRNIFVFIYISA